MALIVTKKKIIAKRIIKRDSNYLGNHKKDRSVHLFNHERVRSSRVIGWCHNVIHQGYIDICLLERHKCLKSSNGSQCECFEKIDNIYWGLTQKPNEIPKPVTKQDDEVTAAQIAEISVAIDETLKRGKKNYGKKKVWEQKPPIERITATARKLLLKKDAYMTSVRDLGDFYEVTYIAESMVMLKDVSYMLRAIYGTGFKMRYVRTDTEKVRYLLNRAKYTEGNV